MYNSTATPIGISLSRIVTIVACAAATLAGSATVRGQSPGAEKASIAAKSGKRDSMTITLQPLQRTEVKLVMKRGEKAEFNWDAGGTAITYNLHGEGPDAPGGRAHTYSRGSSKGEKGEIVAVFDGVHGWSWRNMSEKPVTVKLTAWGQFSELKKM